MSLVFFYNYAVYNRLQEGLCCCLHVNHNVYKYFDKFLHVRSSDTSCLQRFRSDTSYRDTGIQTSQREEKLKKCNHYLQVQVFNINFLQTNIFTKLQSLNSLKIVICISYVHAQLIFRVLTWQVGPRQ